MKRIPVGVLGSTGIVGQQTLQLLKNHPWFEVVYLAASDASSGKSYGEAVVNRWHLAEGAPEEVVKLKVHKLEEMGEAKKKCRVLFSCLATDAACMWEEKYSREGFAVLSTASCHRMVPEVPMIIPEINADHLDILPKGQGFIVVKPNCSIQSIMLPLYPLHQKFRVRKVMTTTLQAISGAGFPGLSSLQIADNVIPHIDCEEEKTEREPLKIFGKVEGKKIIPAADIALSAHCTRVPVLDGHLACVSVSFEKKPGREEILGLWENFKGLDLPSAPNRPIVYFHEKDRPQPRLDRYCGKGMSVAVGRLRPCPLFDYRFVALSHNTIRGASGGLILTAELLAEKKML